MADQEWIHAGGLSAYVVEAWEGGNNGRPGVMRAVGYGAGRDEPIQGLIDQFIAASDGQINLQELKLSGRDALSANQHQAADRLRELFAKEPS